MILLQNNQIKILKISNYFIFVFQVSVHLNSSLPSDLPIQNR